MAKSREKKSTKVVLKNLSLEQFEKRTEKLNISYKTAVLDENKGIKMEMNTFSFKKNLVIAFFTQDSKQLSENCSTGEQEQLLLKYRQQCLSVLGRLTVGNFAEKGVRTTKNGSTSIFYILQYLYKYCKEYQEKQEKQEKQK